MASLKTAPCPKRRRKKSKKLKEEKRKILTQLKWLNRPVLKRNDE